MHVLEIAICILVGLIFLELAIGAVKWLRRTCGKRNFVDHFDSYDVTGICDNEVGNVTVTIEQDFS